MSCLIGGQEKNLENNIMTSDTSIEVSIIIPQYFEDEERKDLALRCLKEVQKNRSEKVELILIFNGIYPFRKEWEQYCDQWHEREADATVGLSTNLGCKMARGYILFMLSNDILVSQEAIDECIRLVKRNLFLKLIKE